MRAKGEGTGGTVRQEGISQLWRPSQSVSCISSSSVSAWGPLPHPGNLEASKHAWEAPKCLWKCFCHDERTLALKTPF